MLPLTYIHNCICDTCRNTLLRGVHNFIHLNLAIALLMGLLVFVGGIERATEHEVSTSDFMICFNQHLNCIMISYV